MHCFVFKRMERFYIITLNVLIIISTVSSAKILAYFPVPSISHQVVFRPIIQELVKRGHEITVLTTDPAFNKGQAPENLTEIDLHDISYDLFNDFHKYSKGEPDDVLASCEGFNALMVDVFQKQIQTKEFQEILGMRKDYFDLLILEEVSRAALILSHFFKVPTVLVNSLGYTINDVNFVGASAHELYYPSITRQKLFDLTILDKIKELYRSYQMQAIRTAYISHEDEMLRRNFGNDVPSIKDLKKNIDLLLLNQYSIWDFNRPVPPNVINIGGIHEVHKNGLPKDLNDFLNKSIKGVIYLSFGTNVSPSVLPVEKIQIFLKVFSELPYDVLWKWDKDDLANKPKNVRIEKWFPQADLLGHPKLKLFITQGGLQSTSEAIKEGVPMLGMPMLADQWYNVEMYRKFKIGKRLDFHLITEDNLKEAILDIIDNESYRQNIRKLNSVMSDEPMTPLERAVWWIEYVLRNGGGKHLRAAAANATWWEYLEIPLLLCLLGIGIIILLGIYLASKFIVKRFGVSNKIKLN